MEEGSDFIVYTLEFCPKCEILKDYLSANNIQFSVADMSLPEALTELRINGVFVQEAPVLQKGSVFLTHVDLFSGDKVNEEKIKSLL